MELSPAETGQRLASLLLASIKNPNVAMKSEVLKVQLIERGSTAPPVTL